MFSKNSFFKPANHESRTAYKKAIDDQKKIFDENIERELENIYPQIENELRSKGRNDEEIENFIISFKREVQVKTMREFKAKLREAALQQANTFKP